MPESAASGVLVTRPAGQATAFGERLQAAGFSPLYLPTLAIAATDPTAAGAALRAALPCDFAVFISANAVQHALPAITAAGGLSANCGVIAVGPASAQALQAAGFRNVLLPEARFDSEGVLSLPALQAVTGKRVVIFRGEGGRTLLAETLAARGADVRALVCYRRVAAGDPVQLAAWLAQDAIAVVTATSRAGLHALMALAGPLAVQLKALPLAVLSPALAESALQAGFSGPLMAADQARDADLVTAVTRLHGTLAVDR
ncbi:uroporphyrinogen-III synthase [Immundisolibacter sp.]|uniref:uroporphyrinogen-III synthase n=1 Tax=Immundisolibacter sp. TaxID=1934948 RepID=UPI0035655362